ncbi:DUF7507 domain-containing protein [Vaginisenegalia massiliensis]|uniref:DUF7507 domain-containing protein n=1 Tax=Vaginisenegalia massiliensis TaxID=2058294 RepID=UPI000F523333|nr:isopeptide-forming domain-containing fimbrial protein [Vaginisenegalia massiliensis]
MMTKLKQNFKKIVSLTLVALLLVQTFVPLGGVFDLISPPQTAYADSSTSTNSNYAAVTGKVSADGKSIVWTVVTNNALYYHSGGMYNYFYPGTGLGAPTNVTMNGTATSLTPYNGYYYTYNGATASKYTYQITTPITDPNRDNYTFTVEDVDYSTRYAQATATVDSTVTSVKVDKVWEDAPATKPTVIFDLYASNSTTPINSYTMNSGTTSYTFIGLPKKDSAGNAITYTVKERPLTGYTQKSKQNSATSWTFTNTNKVGSINIQKTWLNVPTGVTKPTPSFTLKNVNTGQTWTNATYNATTGVATFSNIPKFDANGKPYVFDVTETDMGDYYETIAKTDLYGTKWSATNNYVKGVTTCSIPSGVTSVSNTNFYPMTSTSASGSFIGFNIDINGTWSVPDTAKAGYKFTLQLPKEVSVQGANQLFYLKTADGATAGTGTIDPTSRLVTFTLSSYADTHTNLGGTFNLKGLQASYNDLSTVGTYNLSYTAVDNNCTRTFINKASIDYINQDGSNFLSMFPYGSKDVLKETDTTITWKIVVQGDKVRSWGTNTLVVTDTFDSTYQKWASTAANGVKVYRTDVYANNGYNTGTLTPISPTITSYSNGFKVNLDVSQNQDYFIEVTTLKAAPSPSGLYQNNARFTDPYGYVIASLSGETEKNAAASGSGGTAVGNIYLKKVNQNQTAIAGTEFTLYQMDGKTVVGTPIKTDATGLASFSGVPMGLYYLKETSTASGYLADNTMHEVTVDETGAVTVDGEVNTSTARTTVINYNPPTATKNINGSATNLTTRIGVPFTYNVPVKLPGDIGRYKTFVISDKLANELDFVDGSGQIVVDGAFQNSIGTVAYDAASRTVKLTINDFAALEGASQLTMRFDAKLNSKAVPGTAYPNTATLDYANETGTTGSTTTNVVNVTPIEEPAIDLVKSTTATKLPAAGQTVPYQLKVTNTGNSDLNKVTLTDDKLDLTGKTLTVYNADGTTVSSTATNGNFSLKPTQYAIIKYNVTVTQAMVDAGKLTNNAVAKGTSPANTTVQDTDTVTITGSTTPSIAMDKVADVTQVTKVGDVIKYTFTITNNGQVTLTNVTLTDAKLKLNGVKVADTLAVGATTTYTASYSVTQADIDSGKVLNTATAKGTAPNGTPVEDPGDATVNVLRTLKIDLEKAANKTTFSRLGEEIIYTFTITNVGNVTLTNVNLTDKMLQLKSVPVTPTTLAPGQSTTYTMTYKVTQADLDRGSILNDAVATGTSPAGLIVTDPGEARLESTATPAISLVKDVLPTTYANVGDKLTYSFLVTNTGPITLRDVHIDDPLFSGGVTLAKTTLAPGESTTGTASYQVTQADIDNGRRENTAYAHGFTDTNQEVSAPDDAIAEAVQKPQLLTEKSSDITEVTQVGQLVEYKVATKNTGNTSLAKVKIDDGLPGLDKKIYSVMNADGSMEQVGVTNGNVTLLPGQSLILTAEYYATAADFAKGSILNTATGSGTAPDGTPVSAKDDNTVTAQSNPQITLDKSANMTSFTKVGETIQYTLTAKNTGNVELKSVTLTDDKVNLSKASFKVIDTDGTSVVNASATNGSVLLAPGQSLIATVSYTTTQADVDAGKVLNKAQVTGQDPADKPVTANDNNTVTVQQTPAMMVNKETAKVTDSLGTAYPKNVYQKVDDRIYYTFTFYNTGNQTINQITFTDDKLGVTNRTINLADPLLPGKSYTYTPEEFYAVTQKDVDNKMVDNVVTATGQTPGGPTPPATDTNKTLGEDKPYVDVYKATAKVTDKDGNAYATNTFKYAGDKIYYKFILTNTGNQTLNEVTIKDNKLNIDVTLNLTQAPYKPLAPGQSMTYESELPAYVVTQADVDAGKVDNTVTVTTPGAPNPGTNDNTTPGVTDPDVAVDKKTTAVTDASGADLNGKFQKAGDLIKYAFVITNTGNITLNEVTINDSKLGIKDLKVTYTDGLKPGESRTYTVPDAYKVTQADVDAGSVLNTVTVTAPNDPTPATDTNETPGNPTTDVSVDKKTTKVIDKDGQDLNGKYSQVGDRIYYEFDIKNTGTTTINQVLINDARIGVYDLTVSLTTPLLPGQTYTHKVVAPYTVTQADLDRGQVVNVVSVSVPGDPTPATDDNQTPGNQTAKISTEKTSDVTSVTNVGDIIRYQVIATNAGNVTLTQVKIDDGLPGLYDKVYSKYDENGQLLQSGLTNGFVSLLPGQSLRLEAKYEVDPNNFADGQVVNTATSIGTPPVGPNVEATDDNTVTAKGNPAINLTKFVDQDVVANVGDLIDYTLIAENTGNVVLHDVTISDKKVDLKNANFEIYQADGETLVQTNVPNGNITLQPGQMVIVAVQYRTTQADLDRGEIVNVADVVGTDPHDTPVDSTDQAVVDVAAKPDMAVQKETSKITNAAGQAYADKVFKAVGDKIYYSFTFTNTGNQTINQITWSDDKLGVTDQVIDLTDPLLPGQSYTYVAKEFYTVTQADLDKGNVLNTVTSQGKTPTSQTPPVTDDNLTPADGKPAVSVNKETTKVTNQFGTEHANLTYNQVGDRIYYQFVVTNTGNVTVKQITLNDAKLGVNNLTIDLAQPLLPGQSYTYVVDTPHTVTQADLDAGQYLNTVSVSTPGMPTPTTDDNETPGSQLPDLDVVKKTSAVQDKAGKDLNGVYSQVGDQIFYEFDISNRGNTTIKQVTINDQLLGITDLVVNLDTPLLPGQTYTYEVVKPYVVVQKDLDQGKVLNHVTVSTPGDPTPEEDDNETPGDPQPDVAVTKKTTQVTDANGKDLSGTYSQVGDLIYYEFAIKNIGNTTINQVTITDERLGILNQVVDLTEPLLPGQTYTHKVTKPYEIQQGDLDAGKVTNAVTVSTPNDPTPGQGENETPGTQAPAFTVDKKTLKVTASDGTDRKGTFEQAGDLIYYEFDLKNTGNVSISQFVINDEKLGIKDLIVELPTLLLPGQTYRHVVDQAYVVQQADVDAGKVLNVVSVTAPGVNPPVTDENETPGNQNPDVSVTKKVFRITDAAGQVKDQYNAVDDLIFYGFVIKNTGNTTIDQVTITDTKLGVNNLSVTLPSPLAPGDSYEYRVAQAHKVTQADLDAGSVMNSVTVSTPNDPTPGEDQHEEVGGQTPGITIEKTSDLQEVHNVGDVVTYQMVATNTGNTTLTKVNIADGMTDLYDHAYQVLDKNGQVKLDNATNGQVALEPGQSLKLVAKYKAKATDFAQGYILNIAQATGTSPSGTPVEDTDDNTVTATMKPAISLKKTSNKSTFVNVGDEIIYTLTAENTGNVVLKNVELFDDKVDLTKASFTVYGTDGNPVAGAVTDNGQVSLEPGQQLVAEVTYKSTQADVDAGKVVNVAKVTGQDPSDKPVEATDDNTVTVTQTPNMSVVKETVKVTDSAGTAYPTANYKAVGDRLYYSFTFTNTGNQSITEIKYSDDKLGIKDVFETLAEPLLPGKSVTITPSQFYTITQDDLDAGRVKNTVTATGTTPGGPTPPTEDGNYTPADGKPFVSINKSTTKVTDAKNNAYPGLIYQKAGDKIYYKFDLENTGNQTVNQVTITDDKLNLNMTLDLTQSPYSILKPGDKMTYTAKTPYVVTQADVDVDPMKVHNVATVTSPNQPVPSEDGNDTLGASNPDVSVDKRTAKVIRGQNQDLAGKFSQVGDQIYYDFEFTNTGNMTLTEVTITDSLLGMDQVSYQLKQPLLPGDKEVYHVLTPYVVTQADLDRGYVHNVVSVTAPRDPIPNEDQEDTPGERNTEIKLVKDASQTSYAKVGDVIDFNFTVTNTGSVTLTDVKVDDPMLKALGTNVDLAKTTLAPGESTTATAKYTVTQADLDSGKVMNIATATGTPPAPSPGQTPLTPPTDEATKEVPGQPNPQLSLDKVSVEDTYVKAGDIIHYDFTVRNEGNVTLTNVKVTDPMINKLGLQILLEQTVLAPGQSTLGHAEYRVTQADVDAGQIHNVATATGTTPNGDTPKPAEDDDTVTGDQTAAIQLDKTSVETSYAQVGDKITYIFTVTNTGNTTLKDVRVNDPMFINLNIPITLASTTLAPGESTEAKAIYTVTQADLDAGHIYNHASATGTPPTQPNGQTPPSPVDDAEHDVPAVENPSIHLEKTATEPEFVKAGDVIHFNFKVENTGNITLDKIEINDPLLSGLSTPIQLDKTTLKPGEVATASASYTVTQADVDAGHVYNAATVTGTPPSKPGEPVRPPVEDKDDHDVPGKGKAAIQLEKVANQSEITHAGQVVQYQFKVTNTGEISLNYVEVSDPMLNKLGIQITLAKTSLAPGESTTGTADYTVTQADVDAGHVYNKATATGIPSLPVTPPTATDDVDIPGKQQGQLVLTKDAKQTEYKQAGDVIDYVFTVENTGNVTMDNIKVDDPMLAKLNIAISLDKTTLKPGEKAQGTAQYIITQADVDAGHVYNAATATGTTPNNPDTPIRTPKDDHDIPAKPTTGIELVKTARETSYVKAGDVITYEFTVKNTGTTRLTNVKVDDPMLAKLNIPINLAKTDLAPGESTSGTAQYTVTQADVEAGKIYNKATATGTPPHDPNDPNKPLDPPTDEDEHTVPGGDLKPGIKLVKDAKQGNFTKVGEVIDFTFTVTNTGNTTLTDVKVSDPMIDAPITLDKTTLKPGEEAHGTAQYTVTQADVEAGKVYNKATTTGTPPKDPNNPDKPITPPTDEDEHTVPGGDLKPGIKLVKDAKQGNFTKVGEVIDFTFTVTNTGNTTLTDVKVSDPMIDAPITLDKTTLKPGEEAHGTAQYTVTQADVEAGKVYNKATTTGTPPKDPNDPNKPITPPTDEDDHTVPGNKPDPETVNVNVVKSWQMIKGNPIPSKAVAVLDQTGEKLELNASNNWAGSFKDLPKLDENGKEINYTVSEVKMEGFTTKISGDMKAGFVILNVEDIPNIPIPEPTPPAPGAPSKAVGDASGSNQALTRTLKDIKESFSFVIKADIKANMNLEQFAIKDQLEPVFAVNGVQIRLNGSGAKEAIDKFNEAKDKLKDLEKQLADLESTTEAATSEAATTADNSQEIAALKQQITELETQRTALTSQADSQNAQLEADYQAQLANYQAALANYQAAVNQASAIQAQIDAALAADPTADVSGLQASMPAIPAQPVAPAQPAYATTDTSAIDQQIQAAQAKLQALQSPDATSQAETSQTTSEPAKTPKELQDEIDKLKKEMTEKLEPKAKAAEKVLQAGNDATKLGSLSVNGNTVNFNITDKDILKVLEGYQITMVIQASIKDGADLSAYTKHNVAVIPNQAQVEFDHKPVATNTVFVIVPPEHDKPTEPKPENPVTETTTTTTKPTPEPSPSPGGGGGVPGPSGGGGGQPKGDLPATGEESLPIVLVSWLLIGLGSQLILRPSNKRKGE